MNDIEDKIGQMWTEMDDRQGEATQRAVSVAYDQRQGFQEGLRQAHDAVMGLLKAGDLICADDAEGLRAALERLEGATVSPEVTAEPSPHREDGWSRGWPEDAVNLGYARAWVGADQVWYSRKTSPPASPRVEHLDLPAATTKYEDAMAAIASYHLRGIGGEAPSLQPRDERKER